MIRVLVSSSYPAVLEGVCSHLGGVDGFSIVGAASNGQETIELARSTEVLMIRQFHETSDGTYGAPRILAHLQEAGIRISRKRVASLMCEAGLVGVSRRKGVWTTRRSPEATAAPDLVERDFTAEHPDEKWVADITYVPTASGFLFLSIVLDRRRFATKAEARLAIFRYIEGWYNPGRRHSSLGQVSPIAFEKTYRAEARIPKHETVH
jgi:transposase InsO family protein